MDIKEPPVETWEMMKVLKMSIGQTGMQKIFSCGQGQINRYCRDPKSSSDTERNPIDRMRLLLIEAWESDEEETALAILKHLAAPLGWGVVKEDPVTPDQPTSWQEAAQDSERLGRRNQAMREGKHPDIIDAHTRATITDIMETSAKYREEQSSAQKATFSGAESNVREVRQ